MPGNEILSITRKFYETSRKALDLCDKIQNDLNDDVTNNRITLEEWKQQTEENRMRRLYFLDQLEIFSKRLDKPFCGLYASVPSKAHAKKIIHIS